MSNETKDRPASAEDRRGETTKPFFARFLEGQRAEPGPTTTNMTLKYPSDRDEDIDPALGLSHLS